MPLCRDQRAGAERDRGTDDRANIVRVGYLIEHQDQACVAKRAERLRPQWLCFDKRTLVDRLAAGDFVDVLRVDNRCGEGQGANVRNAEPFQRVARHQHTANLPLGIVEGRADGMQPVEADQPIGRLSAGRHRFLRAELRCAPGLITVGAAQACIVAVFGCAGFFVGAHGRLYIRTYGGWIPAGADFLSNSARIAGCRG